MPNYADGKIYTIRNRNDTTLIYVGSTTQPLYKRFYKHKEHSTTDRKCYFHNLVEDWNDWYIELYEKFPCESSENLLKREGEVIREIGKLNKNIAGRTKNEYMKEYYQKVESEKNIYGFVVQNSLIYKIENAIIIN